MRTIKRMLALANVFNLLVAVYFIIIAITALVQLRWYHQLTVTARVRHVATTASSYFAFLLLLFAALLLLAVFLLNHLQPASSHKVHISGEHPATHHQEAASTSQEPKHRSIQLPKSPRRHNTACCTTFLHLTTSAALVVILIIWLLNTGELVRDSIASQLEEAFRRYQFSNRSNHYSVAVDGMQNINNCCGQLDYTDFPRHHRTTGLTPGHYPGSCCGKNIFGVNARVICVPEEIVRARQTTGCVHVLANYYDLISLLVVPVALICLFVNITIIALITISKVRLARQESLSTTDESNSQTVRLDPLR